MKSSKPSNKNDGIQFSYEPASMETNVTVMQEKSTLVIVLWCNTSFVKERWKDHVKSKVNSACEYHIFKTDCAHQEL